MRPLDRLKHDEHRLAGHLAPLDPNLPERHIAGCASLIASFPMPDGTAFQFDCLYPSNRHLPWDVILREASEKAQDEARRIRERTR